MCVCVMCERVMCVCSCVHVYMVLLCMYSTIDNTPLGWSGRYVSVGAVGEFMGLLTAPLNLLHPNVYSLIDYSDMAYRLEDPVGEGESPLFSEPLPVGCIVLSPGSGGIAK